MERSLFFCRMKTFREISFSFSNFGTSVGIVEKAIPLKFSSLLYCRYLDSWPGFLLFFPTECNAKSMANLKHWLFKFWTLTQACLFRISGGISMYELPWFYLLIFTVELTMLRNVHLESLYWNSKDFRRSGYCTFLMNHHVTSVVCNIVLFAALNDFSSKTFSSFFKRVYFPLRVVLTFTTFACFRTFWFHLEIEFPRSLNILEYLGVHGSWLCCFWAISRMQTHYLPTLPTRALCHSTHHRALASFPSNNCYKSNVE